MPLEMLRRRVDPRFAAWAEQVHTASFTFRSDQRAVDVGMSDKDIDRMKAALANVDGATLSRHLLPELVSHMVKVDAARLLKLADGNPRNVLVEAGGVSSTQSCPGEWLQWLRD